MFSKHVTKKISAYCQEELSADESKQFMTHVMSCASCREQYEEIKCGIKFAEQLPRLEAPDALWQKIEATLTSAPARSTSKSFFNSWPTRAAAAAVILLVGGLGVWWFTRDHKSRDAIVGSWAVERINGTLRIGSTGVENKGQLAVGQWLETGGDSRAQIDVSSIGQVEVDSNTRLRLVQTQPTEHRVELERGKMSARIWAPPRLFFVDTPSAVAADLGCAYTLEVDEHGGSLLRVTAGWVALELKDRESIVPSGAACQTRTGIGPGTPYFEDASIDFQHSLSTIDFDTDVAAKKLALDDMLKRSRPRDTLTLWHLLPRVDVNARALLFDKMASFVPPPSGVTKEGILQLDQKMLESWKFALEGAWSVPMKGPKGVPEAYWNGKTGIDKRTTKLP